MFGPFSTKLATNHNPQGAVRARGHGGMFSVIKVHQGLARNDYTDPGWHTHTPRCVARGLARGLAREWTGPSLPQVDRQVQPNTHTPLTRHKGTRLHERTFSPPK